MTGAGEMVEVRSRFGRLVGQDGPRCLDGLGKLANLACSMAGNIRYRGLRADTASFLSIMHVAPS